MSRLFLLEEALNEERQEKTMWRLRQRQKPMRALTDIEVIREYRVNRTILQSLCEDLVPLLPPTNNSRAIDPIQKILIALQFYARGSYQRSVGNDDTIPMAQQSVSTCLKQVTDALNDPLIVAKYIHFPKTRAERNIIKRGFYEMCNLPGISGCIDCTHISIVKPNKDEERFFNRKHYHSLNVEMICDDNLKLLHVDARYGGATHDSFIWRNSPLVPHFQRVSSGELSFLLGDSGYPLREYLMTPVENPTENSPEWHFNKMHKKARSVIERTFGILKGRWRCLLAARELHYSPQRAGKIIIACSILHNMCINDILEPIDLSANEQREEAERQPAPVTLLSDPVGLLEGRRVRQNLINNLQY